MSHPSEHGSSRWFNPRRDWLGPRAMVPVDTCYKMLDLYCRGYSLMCAIGLTALFATDRGAIARNPLFAVTTMFAAANWAGTILRGLPFLLRYGMFVTSLFVTEMSSVLVLGLSPNVPFMLLVMLSSVALFFGTRRALLMLLALFTANIGVAWGWVHGYLPLFMSGPREAAPYLDSTSAIVWFRVSTVASVLIALMLLVMRFLLRDTKRALGEAERALQRLAVEQESRARAEEARMKAEGASRDAQKFDALGRLAAGVAHDVNNALCVVKSYGSLMAEAPGDQAAVLDAVAAIQAATANAEQLTHHLLAFSRSDASLRVGVADLSEVVRLESKTLGRILPSNIQVTAEAVAPLFVPLSRGSLQEIIINMAINARDAMPKGGRLGLRVAAEANGSGGRWVRLDVADTGVGIDKATQERIFEPFFTTKPSGVGTGLGLSMVYGLVSGVGGTISVDSSPETGSRFTIRLPEIEAAQARDAASSKSGILSSTRCRVLVAEDQPQLLTLVERVLSNEGFPVIATADGDSALAALSVPGSLFGLMIVDAVMPGFPTNLLIERALSINPGCRVIVSSAHASDDRVLSEISAGARIHSLSKPFDVSQLREAVNVVLSRSA